MRAVVDRIARAVAASPTGLLPRERYSSDIAAQVVSLHGQTLVWQGLLAMSRVWTETGHRPRQRSPESAASSRRAPRRGARIGAALPGRTLFVPAALARRAIALHAADRVPGRELLEPRRPVRTRIRILTPHGAQARGLLRYMLLHGSRLLGLVRAGAYRLARSDASVSGTDQVYGVNVSRFLADNDETDQLVLSLYGTLAAALTPGTFVAGEAASVTPLRGALYRTMYLPPNNDTAATFLETLRSMLVHETAATRVLRSGSSLHSRRRGHGSRTESRSSSPMRRPASARSAIDRTRRGHRADRREPTDVSRPRDHTGCG